MSTAEYSSENIHTALKYLVDLKTERDGKKFSFYQLAKAIDMPHSMIVKLAHADEAKRITNPKIETLTRIIEFFKNEGFDVSIDTLFSPVDRLPREMELASCSKKAVSKVVIPLFSMKALPNKALRSIESNVYAEIKNAMAFVLENDIGSFKKGTVLIVDPDALLEANCLVMAKIKSNPELQLRKYYEGKQDIILISLDEASAPESFSLKSRNVKIIGVVVQANIKLGK